VAIKNECSLMSMNYDTVCEEQHLLAATILPYTLRKTRNLISIARTPPSCGISMPSSEPLAYSFLSPLSTSTPSRSCSRKTSVRIVWGHNLTLNPSVSSHCSNARRRDVPCSGPSTEEERQALCLDGLHYDLRYALRNRASQTWRKGRMEKRTSALLFAAITRDLTTSAGAQTARRAGLAPVGFYQ
jgi:hypothetical protein